jgi:hypothetical protein
MKKVRSVMLALLAAVLAPILIWAGLFVALRRPLLVSFRRLAAVAAALFAAVAAPVLIWVGLLVAVKEHVQVWRLHRAPGRTISEILADAGLTIEWKTASEPAPVMGMIMPVSMTTIHRLLELAGLAGYSDAELFR